MIDDQVQDRVLTVLRALKAHTLTGAIEWQLTDRQTYQTSVERSSFAVGTRDGDGLAPFNFTMYDSSGNPVANVATGDGDFGAPVVGAVEDLFMSVHLNTGRMISLLDRAIKELGDVPPF